MKPSALFLFLALPACLPLFPEIQFAEDPTHDFDADGFDDLLVGNIDDTSYSGVYLYLGTEL